MPRGAVRASREVRAEVRGPRVNLDAQGRHEAFWAGLAEGTVLHYENCTNAFVRGVVVMVDGESMIMPQQLVGHGWKIWAHTAPHYQEMIAQQKPWRPHATRCWEHAITLTGDQRPLGPQSVDPTGLSAFDFTQI